MARKRVVTRTIKTTKGIALAVDKDERKLEQRTFTVSGHIDVPERILKMLNERKDGYIYTMVESSEFDSDLYVMPEDEFIAMATIVEKDEDVE